MSDEHTIPSGPDGSLVWVMVACVAAAFCWACSSAPYYRRPVDVTVEAPDSINRDTPVAVEVVYVYQPALVDTLSSLTSDQWFERHPDLAWKHPNGFDRWRWEWVPGQSIPTQHLPLRFFTRGVFVYAGYRAPGAHRAQIPPYRSFELQLNQNGFQVRVSP